MSASRMFCARKQQFFILIVLSVISHAQNQCKFELDPEVKHNKELDKKFQIKLDDNVKYFFPGDTYIIIFSSAKSNLHFNEYYLETLPEAEDDYSERSKESFEEEDKSYQRKDTRKSYPRSYKWVRYFRCSNNLVKSETTHPKRTVEVDWRSPADRGCYILRGTIVVYHLNGTKEYGVRRRKICSYNLDKDNYDNFLNDLDRKPSTCCACGEAKYEMVFEALVGVNFTGLPLTRFGDVIGASHSQEFHMLQPNGLYREGLKSLVKNGSSSQFESEMKDESEHIRTIIKSRGISTVGGRTFAVFRVDPKNHYISLVSQVSYGEVMARWKMPDRSNYTVGVSGFELCLPNCTWVQNSVVNLFPTIQKRNKLMVRPMLRSVARLYITRESLYDDDCGMLGDDTFSIESDRANYRAKAREDDEDESYDDASEELEKEAEEEDEEEKRECALSDWSEWTDCNNSCGKGKRSRRRAYKHYAEWCQQQKDDVLQEVQECVGIECPESAETDFVEDEMCRTSGWSEWSPCSKTCGRGGRKARYRSLLSQSLPPPSSPPQSPATGNSINSSQHENNNVRFIELQCGHVPLVEERICGLNQPPCTDRLYHPPKYCMKRPKTGFCRHKLQRWYYNHNADDCEPFSFTGCGGNNNNFYTFEDCLKVCKPQQIRPLPQPS